MKIIFDDTCEQDLMVASIKSHIIQLATSLPTMPTTANNEDRKPIPKEYYELGDWMSIYKQAWGGEIKEKEND